MKITIIGLGYVGLPLSLQFARSGVTVLGLDIDPAKVAALNEGNSYIHHIESSAIAEMVTQGTFLASTDFSRIREVEAVIICVPTPLRENREPDISYVLNTGRSIAPYLQKGTLVVLESTTYPGTTEEDLKNVLEEFSGTDSLHETRNTEHGSDVTRHAPRTTEHDTALRSKLRAGVDFHLAYSPEREDPGNPNSKVADIPKIVGGYTPQCLERAKALYSKAIKTVIPVSSCRVAEATKLLENIFRSVNIALVNELKLVYTAMGIDIWEVINAAKTKPFGFMPFYPGPGLGGHCIPIDPFYLSWKARQSGKETRFIELAGEINTAMPEYVVQRVAEALRDSATTRLRDHKATGLRDDETARQKESDGPIVQPSGGPADPLSTPPSPLSGSKILVLGLAYKPNVDDDRESPTYVLMDLLKAHGADVAYFDPFVPVIRPSREHSHWAGVRSVEWNRQTISSFDAVLISTAHTEVNYPQLAEWSPCIIDTRNVMANIPTEPGQIWSA